MDSLGPNFLFKKHDQDLQELQTCKEAVSSTDFLTTAGSSSEGQSGQQSLDVPSARINDLLGRLASAQARVLQVGGQDQHPANEQNCLEIAHLQREIAQVKLYAILRLEEAFQSALPESKSVLGRVLALRDSVLREGAVAFAAEQVYSAIISTTYHQAVEPIAPAEDLLELGAQITGLRQVLAEESLQGRVKLTADVKGILEQQLNALVSHEGNLRPAASVNRFRHESLQARFKNTKGALGQRLGTLAFGNRSVGPPALSRGRVAQYAPDQPAEAELDGIFFSTGQFLTNNNFQPPAAHNVGGLVNWLLGKEPKGLEQNLHELREKIRQLDVAVSRKKHELATATYETEELIRGNFEITHRARLAVIEKIALAGQLINWTDSVEAESKHLVLDRLYAFLQTQLKDEASLYAQALALGTLMSAGSAPVDLERKGGTWRFDERMAAHKKELLYLAALEKVILESEVCGFALGRPESMQLQKHRLGLLKKQEMALKPQQLAVREPADTLPYRAFAKSAGSALNVEQTLQTLGVKISQLKRELEQWELDAPFFSVDEKIRQAPFPEREQLEVERVGLIQKEMLDARRHVQRLSEGPLSQSELEELNWQNERITYYEKLIKGSSVHKGIMLTEALEMHNDKLSQMDGPANDREALKIAVEWKEYVEDTIFYVENTYADQPMFDSQRKNIELLKAKAKGLEVRITRYRKGFRAAYKQEISEELKQEALRRGVSKEEPRSVLAAISAAAVDAVAKLLTEAIHANKTEYLHEWSTTAWGRELRRDPKTTKLLDRQEDILLSEEVRCESIEKRVQLLKGLDPSADHFSVMEAKQKLLEERVNLVESLGRSRQAVLAKLDLLNESLSQGKARIEPSLLDQLGEVAQQLGSHLRKEKAQVRVLKTELANWKLEEPLFELGLRIQQSKSPVVQAQLELKLEKEIKRLIKRYKAVVDGPSVDEEAKKAVKYYTDQKNSKARKQRVLLSRTVLLEDKLARLLAMAKGTEKEAGDFDRLTHVLEQAGEGVVAARAELDLLAAEIELLPFALPEKFKEKLKKKINIIKTLFEELKERQSSLQKQYELRYRKNRKAKIQQETSDQLVSSAQNMIQNFVGGFQQALAAPKLIYVHEWQTDADAARALSYIETQLIDASLRQEIIREQIGAEQKIVETSKNFKKSQEAKAKIESLKTGLRAAFCQTRELETQKYATVLDQIIELTNTKRCLQKKVEAEIVDLREFVDELRKGQDRGDNVGEELAKAQRRLDKRIKTNEAIKVSFESLETNFKKNMEHYQGYKEPQRTLADLLAKTAWDSAKAMVSLGYLKTGFTTPKQFQARWEVAQLGYECSTALAGFTAIKGHSLPQALSGAVIEFLEFAKTHPTTAEGLLTDIALTVSLLGDEALLDTLTKGMSTRLAARALTQGMSGRVIAEPPLEEKDLKWIALADIAKHGTQAAAGVKAAKATWEGLKTGGLLGGLLGGVEAIAWEAPKNALIQKVVKEISPEYLNAVDTTLRAIRGDDMADILANQARLAQLQIAGTVADAMLNPKGFVEGVRHYVNHQRGLFLQAGLGEKALRLAAVVGIPAAGVALAAAGGALTAIAFALVGSIFIAAPAAYSMVNFLYASTEAIVKENEARCWLAKDADQQALIEKRRADILQGLQGQKMLPIAAPEVPEEELIGQQNLLQRRADLLRSALETLDKEYKLMQQAAGSDELQVNEVLDLFIKETNKPSSSIPADIEEIKIYLQEYVSYELGEKWLKDKLRQACEYEFVVMVSYYNSVAQYESSRLQRDSVKRMPITRNQVAEVDAKIRSRVEEKVKQRLPEVFREDEAGLKDAVSQLLGSPI